VVNTPDWQREGPVEDDENGNPSAEEQGHPQAPHDAPTDVRNYPAPEGGFSLETRSSNRLFMQHLCSPTSRPCQVWWYR
jgi:hypothetical protein